MDVRYIIPMFGVTLRAGSRDYFYGALDRDFPGMKQRYEEVFGEEYMCDSPQHKRLWEICGEAAGKAGIPLRMEFWSEEKDGQQRLF